MASLALTRDDGRLLVGALEMQMNFIQCGNPRVTVSEAKESGRADLVKALSERENYLVAQITAMIARIKA